MSQHCETIPTAASNINAEVLTTALNNVFAPKSVSAFNAGSYKNMQETDRAATSWLFSVRRQLTHQTKISKEVFKISWCIDHLELNARDIEETHSGAQRFVSLADFEDIKENNILGKINSKQSFIADSDSIHSGSKT